MEFRIMRLSEINGNYKELDLSKCLFISINDTVLKPFMLPIINKRKFPNLVDSLVMQFDDITPEINFSNYMLFNETHANQIYNFIQKNKKEPIEKIIVQCAFGKSRSAGVCASLMEYFNKDSSEIFKNNNFTPNMYVYKTLNKILSNN